MEVVKTVAKKDGLTIQVTIFDNYLQPNIALHQGQIDANSFQNQPYLENMINERKYELATAAKTIIFPMGLYSKKIRKPAELSPDSIVAIPSDPINGARALLLLETTGLIQLKPGAGPKTTVGDITINPNKIRIWQADAAKIPAMLDYVDLAAINSNDAARAGLVPGQRCSGPGKRQCSLYPHYRRQVGR